MAAGLGFKDFTTGEVLTAADVDGYLMQGVWVFASAAARDAAVTSPQEGNFAYLKDTNVTTYYTGSAWANLDTTGMTNPMTTTGDTIYSSSGSTPARLGIGSTGQVLTVSGGVPTWAAAASGGMTLISTTTLSGATTTITVASNSYKNLVIFAKSVDASTDCDIYCQINGETGATAYTPVMVGSSNGVEYTKFSKGNGIYLNLTGSLGFGSSNDNFTVITIPDANSTIRKIISFFNGGTSSSSVFAQQSMVTVSSSAVISSIDFKASGGATFDGGSILLYGVS